LFFFLIKGVHYNFLMVWKDIILIESWEEHLVNQKIKKKGYKLPDKFEGMYYVYMYYPLY